LSCIVFIIIYATQALFNNRQVLLKAIHKTPHKNIKVEARHDGYHPSSNVTKELFARREHVKAIVQTRQIQPVLHAIVFRR
jgi:hypothetical protein